MTDESLALIGNRMQRARETLGEAELLASEGHWYGCTNRLYYACFYAVSALLLSRGLASAKHSGVLSLFNREFVKSGAVSRELGETYNDLYRDRMATDYEDLAYTDEAKVRPYLAAARRLIADIDGMLARTP